MTAHILYSTLENLNRPLAEEFDAIRRESFKIWEEQYMRPFTTHGKLHSERVERNLDSLTRPLKEPLTAEEIFILLSACYLHDIGMQLIDDSEARSRHAQYAYDLIL